MEEVSVDSLDSNRSLFVNRDCAVQQLQAIHQEKYNRSVNNVGLEWGIPLSVSVRGMGKTVFGQKYIRKCREAWKAAGERSDFQKDVCACRTIHLALSNRGLTNSSFDSVMIQPLCRELKKLSSKSPAILDDPPKTVHTFLIDLTNEIGPLSIMLDEFGVHSQIGCRMAYTNGPYS